MRKIFEILEAKKKLFVRYAKSQLQNQPAQFTLATILLQSVKVVRN